MKFTKIWPTLVYTFSMGIFSFHQYSHSARRSLENGDWKNPLSWVDANDTLTYITSDQRSPASVASYKQGGDCDGFPGVDLSTAPGFCLGVIDNGEGLLKPRFAIELENGDLVLSDMGSWDPMKGKIFYYKKKGATYERSVLFSAQNLRPGDERSLVLDRPNQLLIGPDNLVYIGSSTAILRFDPKSADPLKSLEVVIKNLPGLGLHNLKAMVFNNKNQLFINVGSATNVCAKFGLFAKKMKSCPEVEDLAQGQGQIRMYQMLPNGKFDPKFTVYAKGLRNSMGLLFDSQLNALIQVENGRDEINKVSSAFSDNEFPHEEMNIIENGKHYGWPYCFDDNKNNPEWRHVNCSNYRAPYLLLPPHAAPLSIIKHSGTNLPQWYRNRIIASFHGYAQYGHRIVSFLRDENGLPTGVPLSIVYNWKTEENKPGSPVGIFEMKDGSMLIVEDNNKKLLRLHYNEAEGDGKPVREIDLAHAEENIDSEEETRRLKLEEVLRDKDASAFARFQSQVIDRQCVQCHGSEASPGIQLKKYDYLGNEKKLKELGKEQEILGRISGNPNYPTMPPSGFSSKEEQDQAVALLRAWIKEK